MKKINQEKAEEIEKLHNVYVDIEKILYNNDGPEEVYGWHPIPKEWMGEDKCDNCGDWTDNIISDGITSICEECEECYFSCSKCGKLIHMYEYERGDYYINKKVICYDCQE